MSASPGVIHIVDSESRAEFTMPSMKGDFLVLDMWVIQEVSSLKKCKFLVQYASHDFPNNH